VKHHQQVEIAAALTQAQSATDGRPPVAISRSNRAPITVTMLIDDWIALVERTQPANDPCPSCAQDKADHDAMTALGDRGAFS
jgi:hypothetical protein